MPDILPKGLHAGETKYRCNLLDGIVGIAQVIADFVERVIPYPVGGCLLAHSVTDDGQNIWA